MEFGKAFLVYIALFVGVVLTDKVPTKEDFDNVIKECHKIYPIEESEIKDLTHHIHKDDADRLQKCFTRCFMESTKMMDHDGNFDVQRIYEIVQAKHKDQLKDDPMDAIKECTKPTTEKNICMKAYAAVKCVDDKKLW